MTSKAGDLVVATTNRAPLVRGQTYRILEVIDGDSPTKTQYRLEGLPMWEPYFNFRPADPVDEAVTKATGDPTPSPTMTPALPDGNPKTRFGIAKPPLSLIPGLARVHLAEAFRDGAAKYGPANWRQDPVTTSTYLNAAERHIVSWQDGEEVAPDSGVHHLAHAAACLLILLDAQAAGSLQDDRPTPAPTAALIREKTRPLI